MCLFVCVDRVGACCVCCLFVYIVCVFCFVVCLCVCLCLFLFVVRLVRLFVCLGVRAFLIGDLFVAVFVFRFACGFVWCGCDCLM